MSSISVCMIVKNEAKNLEKCLESVYNLANEIIIVDTGSTDDSRQIAEKFNAKIYNFEWQDNFADARNFSLEKANCEWILVLDADEVCKVRDIEGIKKYLENAKDFILIKITNYCDESIYFSHSVRLFRNGKANFSGAIHEQLACEGNQIDITDAIKKHLSILHYGYGKRCQEQKRKRNLKILQKERQTPFSVYYLAAEYYSLGEIQSAYLEINRAIILFLSERKKPPAFAYKLKYEIIFSTKSLHLADGIEKAIMLYPDYVDLYYYKSLLCEHRGDKIGQQKALDYCIILGEGNVNYLIEHRDYFCKKIVP